MHAGYFKNLPIYVRKSFPTSLNCSPCNIKKRNNEQHEELNAPIVKKINSFQRLTKPTISTVLKNQRSTTNRIAPKCNSSHNCIVK